VAIDVRDRRMWRLEAHGLRQAESVRLDNGVAFRRERRIPFNAIKELAVRQPPFAPGWEPAEREVIAALRPIEADVVVDDRSALADRAEDGPGRTPLIDAAAGGSGTGPRRLALVDALIRGANVNATEGGSVNVRSSDGRTAVMLASESLASGSSAFGCSARREPTRRYATTTA
jgi:Ankyrin repeat